MSDKCDPLDTKAQLEEAYRELLIQHDDRLNAHFVMDIVNLILILVIAFKVFII